MHRINEKLTRKEMIDPQLEKVTRSFRCHKAKEFEPKRQAKHLFQSLLQRAFQGEL